MGDVRGPAMRTSHAVAEAVDDLDGVDVGERMAEAALEERVERVDVRQDQVLMCPSSRTTPRSGLVRAAQGRR